MGPGMEDDLTPFQRYLLRFEKNVVIKGVEIGLFTKTLKVPVKKGKLDRTRFGLIIGSVFEHELPIVIDYYGLLKKSTGLLKLGSTTKLRRVEATAVHFPSIRMNTIIELSPDLARGFSRFKRKLVNLRGFDIK
jgi:hypothetical protein